MILKRGGLQPMDDLMITNENKIMDKVAVQTISDRFEILTPLNSRENVFLVMDQQTREICVEKIILEKNKSFYQYILDHPMEGIPHIYEMEAYEDKLIVIEEYIHGMNLEQRILQKGCLPESEVVEYMVGLCHTLIQFHDMSPCMIHKDIKPSNLVLANHGSLYLIDFNVSREYKPSLELDTTMIVSHHFSAPELYGFGQSDVRSDIYSIGATMHYLLTGGYLKETTYCGPLKKIIEKCTMIDPDDRYQTVRKLQTVLKKNCDKGWRSDFQNSEQKGNAYIEGNHFAGSFLPPGFRTKTVWKMVLAAIVYAMIFDIALTMNITSALNGIIGKIDIWLERLYTLLLFLATVGLICNYRNCQDMLPFGKVVHAKILRIALGIFMLCSSFMTILVLTVWFLGIFD